MSSSQNIQMHPSSIQLSRLFPNLAYQSLQDPPQNSESAPQSNRSENLPQNINHIQSNITRSSIPDFNQARDAEAEFKKAFDRFFKKYCSNQRFTLAFFLILVTGTTPSPGLAAILLIGLAAVYLVHLGSALCRAETPIDTFRITYKIFEFLGAAVYVVWNPFNSSQDSVNAFFACLLINYLLKTVLAYYSNRSSFVRFVNQVNKTILGIRACIFTQGMLLIVLAIMEIEVSGIHLVLIPYFILNLVIVLFTANLIRNVYFVYKAQFWRSATAEKKIGLRWIFGNLLSIIGILFLENFLQLADDPDSAILVCVAIVTWCSISLLYSEYCRDGVFKVCEALAIIIQNKIQVQAETPIEDIKYVTRISNTYFRPATSEEISRFTEKPASDLEVSGEEDLEAGVENNNGEEKLKCIVCCRKLANAVFMECGHGGICFSCGKKISKQQQKECHMCRQKIRLLLKINLKENHENVYEIIKEMKSQEQRELSWYVGVS